MAVMRIKVNGNWIEIPTIKGDQGDDYNLTTNDYAAIAEIVYQDYMTNAENEGY